MFIRNETNDKNNNKNIVEFPWISATGPKRFTLYLKSTLVNNKSKLLPNSTLTVTT